jgi:KaiC/GvpD/RAD55 family RecA-like ATPase
MGMPLAEDFRFIEEETVETRDYPVKRIPTGVPDFDHIIRGGIPSGSVIILLGEDGAGHHEYAYTSVAKIEIAKRYPKSRTFFLGTNSFDFLPEKVCYVTFSRSKENILQEIGATFNYDFYSVFRDNVVFKDFSSKYFKNTIVPQSWTKEHENESLFQDQSNLISEDAGKNLLEDMVSFLDANSKDSVIIIDSLTDLVTSEAINLNDLAATLKGLRRAAKNWDGMVYLLLTQGIMDNRQQQMLVEGVDGLLVFEWSRYHRSSKRQRFMYVEKFTSILAHIERKRIAKFPIMITSKGGLVISSLEMIS